MKSKENLKSEESSLGVGQTSKEGFATVEEAIQQFQAGGMVIVVDDEERMKEILRLQPIK